MLSPGALIEGHKDLEHGDCLKCHDPSNGVPEQRCLDCHTDIAKVRDLKKTFHGLQKKTCVSCHSDHKGRNFDAAKVDQKAFNHTITGFTLRNAHLKPKCEECHTIKRVNKPFNPQGIRYFGQDPSCKSCHLKEDIHKFTEKYKNDDCNSCHTDKNWRDTPNFNHERDAEYGLKGSHAKLKCEKCHLNKAKTEGIYQWPNLKSQRCLNCHDDYHKNDFRTQFKGPHCDKCHTQEKWTIARFDHNVTGFSLQGAHKPLNCQDCHKSLSSGAKIKIFGGLNANCKSCHADYHGFYGETSGNGKNLTACQLCHQDSSWKKPLSFNHTTDTAYPLTGKHLKVKCFECHTKVPGPEQKPPQRTYEFPQLEKKNCETCHKSPHLRTFPPKLLAMRCDACHNTEGWMIINGDKDAFNHESTRFPLRGDHTRLKCESCHLKGKKMVYKFEGAEKQFCVTCHQSPHRNQFSPSWTQASCASCHNQSDFKYRLDFNHSKTRFKLDGAHAKPNLACEKCHTPTKQLLMSKPPRPAGRYQFPLAERGFCENCHKNIHIGHFSPNLSQQPCTTCHTTKSFEDLKAFDHNKTNFKIIGAHLNFKEECQKCHTKSHSKDHGKYKFRFAEKGYCEDCHKNVHKQQFSSQFSQKPCISCHTQTSFEKTKSFDHNQTNFKIDGAHTKIENQCFDCHKLTQNLLKTTPPKRAHNFSFKFARTGYCEDCHRNEHKGQFREKFAEAPCKECHSTQSFTKSYSFDHNLSRFPLKAKHKKVACRECHRPSRERYKLSSNRFKGTYIFRELGKKDCALCHKDPHKGANGPKCSECHSESGWHSTGSFHQNFTLKGVHFTLACAECHKTGHKLSGSSQECQICHTKDDAHLGSLPDCAECHNQQSFNATSFKHSMTEFPLRGAHRLLLCNECHAQGTYEGLFPDCGACHRDQALKVVEPSHNSPNFQDCENCHNQFRFFK